MLQALDLPRRILWAQTGKTLQRSLQLAGLVATRCAGCLFVAGLGARPRSHL
jgi:hypothetical protein